MKNLTYKILLRWVVNVLALYLIFISGLLGDTPSTRAIILGATVLAVLNGILKPILIIFTLPAISLSLGIFLVFINGAIFYIAGKIYAPLESNSFFVAILAGLVVGLLNYILTRLMEAIDNR